MFIKISSANLVRLTDTQHERNMYADPNPIARGIFWQRLAFSYRPLGGAPAGSKVFNFDSGSGAFLPALAQRFTDFSVVDRDLNDARRVAGHYRLGRRRII